MFSGNKPQKILGSIAGIALLGTILLEVFSEHHVIGLANNFRLHLLIAMCFASLLLALLRSRAMFLALIAGAIHSWHVLPLYKRSIPASCDQPLRVISANVLFSHPNPQQFVDWLKQHQDTHVVGLLEVTPAWIAPLQQLRAYWPHWIEVPRNDNFGLVLLSQLPIRSQTVTMFSDSSTPSILAEIEFDKRSVQVILTHPVPPLGRELFLKRKGQIEGIMHALSTREDTPVLAMGDFNLTPTDPLYSKFVQGTNLRNCREGLGWLPTWPSSGLIQIPIDHVFYSPGLGCASFAIGPDVGSDHRPVLASLCIAEN